MFFKADTAEIYESCSMMSYSSSMEPDLRNIPSISKNLGLTLKVSNKVLKKIGILSVPSFYFKIKNTC
jgi:hypothetical protein